MGVINSFNLYKTLGFVITLLVIHYSLVCFGKSDRGFKTEKKTLHPTSQEDAMGSVLMYLPMAPNSHINPFVAIAKGLAVKGHFVTMVVPTALDQLMAFDGGDRIHQIVVEIDFGDLPGMNDNSITPDDSSETIKNVFSKLISLSENVEDIHLKALRHPDMKVVLDSLSVSNDQKKRRQCFDVVFVPTIFNEIGYFLADKLKVPLVLVNGINCNMFLTLQLGYFDNPAFVTSQFYTSSQASTPSFLTRFTTFVIQCFYLNLKKAFIVSVQEKLLQTLNLTDGKPVDLLSIEREAMFGMYTSHYIFDSVRPTLPNTIDIGFIHCRPPKPLGNELGNWFEQSETPVIYVSFGSLVTIDSFDLDIVLALKEAFLRLPYRILIKSKARQIEMHNVMTCEWCPQQDILGHPKTALFISHAGINSIQEAIYHKTPIIAVPFKWDQFANAERTERQGYGKVWRLDRHNDVQTKAEALYLMIVDIVENNDSYKYNIEDINRIVLNSQMETPLERALFWTEYIMKKQGASFLKSHSRHISYFKLLYFDIYLCMICVLGFMAFVVYKCISLVKTKVIRKIRVSLPRRRDARKQD